MKKLFMITNHMDKPMVELNVISETQIHTMDVECVCKNTVAINNYFGRCDNCKREYMGPALIK